jgi:hypothetical protein
LAKGDKGGFYDYVCKISPNPSLPVYARKKITKEGDESPLASLEPITKAILGVLIWISPSSIIVVV